MTPITSEPTRVRQLSTRLADRQLAQLRHDLLRQRAFRADQLSQLAHPADGGPLASTHGEVTHTLVNGARSALHSVQAALWRMDEGTYGLCTVCNHEIDSELLFAVPQTTSCLNCQQALPPP